MLLFKAVVMVREALEIFFCCQWVILARTFDL